MAGCVLGTILRRDSEVASHRQRLAWAGTFALGLFVAGKEFQMMSIELTRKPGDALAAR